MKWDIQQAFAHAVGNSGVRVDTASARFHAHLLAGLDADVGRVGRVYLDLAVGCDAIEHAASPGHAATVKMLQHPAGVFPVRLPGQSVMRGRDTNSS